MRKRTTWVSSEGASGSKTAEDPRAMNQDHLSQQPAADAYVTGGPSEFAEDVHPSSDTWEAEQSGGETKRNEIGMPDFRDDTFKTAGVDMETLHKKGEVCLRVARHMLPGADEETLEFQAAALLHLPDRDVIDTFDRIQTAGKLPPEFLEQQKGKGEDKDEDKDDKKDDKKEAKAATDDQDADDKDGDEDGEQQAKEAKAATDDQDADDKDGDEDDEQQAKEASQACGGGQMFSMDQVQQMITQAVQQQLQQMGGQMPMAQQQPQVQSDDQILDQMLQDDEQIQQAPEMEVQLEGAPMDIGEVQLDQDESATLSALFASNPEVRQAQQAQALQDGVPVTPVAPPATVKNASTRTVGTRPSGGVSQIGGASAPVEASSGSEVNSLAGLWKSAPDVSGIFNPEG